jgi:hypothetical protein
VLEANAPGWSRGAVEKRFFTTIEEFEKWR